jgi:hypothetical protein
MAKVALPPADDCSVIEPEVKVGSSSPWVAGSLSFARSSAVRS